MSAADIEEAAGYFWRCAGSEETFPRALETAAAWALPVAIVRLPRLWVADVESRMLITGYEWKGPDPSLRLRGFMLATRGKGFLFVDGSDPPEEQRYSLAHEISHFLLDYYLPRLDAISKLGVAITEVLDGFRGPTIRERVHASLTATQIGTYEHIAQRNQLAEPASEDRADLLTVELLAPTKEVFRRCKALLAGKSREASSEIVHSILTRDFGLPEFAAAGTTGKLIARWWRQPTFSQWMGIKK